MIRKISILMLMLSLCMGLSAQELRMTVSINCDQIEGSNKQVFQTLKTAIEEFYNGNRFTTLTLRESEKIECTMLIVVNSVTTDGLMKCTMTLQSRRPVFNSAYMTTVMNFVDGDFNFIYREYDRMDYDSNQYTSNLVALLSYYAYILIGEDLDTYEPLGGQACYEQARQINSLCQTATMESSEYKGWKAHESNRSRYALISNLLDEAFRPYREYVYEYHRLGLDRMAENVANGRAKIAENIEVLKTCYRARPATYVINTFLDAKNAEYVDIFKRGNDAEKKKVYDVLTFIDPTRMDEYDAIHQ